MSAAGDFFLRFESITKWILPYKMSAAGENLCTFRALLMGFCLTKGAPQAKILHFLDANFGKLISAPPKFKKKLEINKRTPQFGKF